MGRFFDMRTKRPLANKWPCTEHRVSSSPGPLCGQAEQQALQRDRNMRAQEEGTVVKQINEAERPGRETAKQVSQHICQMAKFSGKTNANTVDVAPVGNAKGLLLLVIVSTLNLTIHEPIIIPSPSSYHHRHHTVTIIILSPSSSI